MKTSTNAEAATVLAQQDALRKRAARQAAHRKDQPVTVAKVEVQVLPMGEDKISMGTHVDGIGDAYFERGERFLLEQPVAEALEARGFVLILDDVERATPAAQAAKDELDDTARAFAAATAAAEAAKKPA